jgi:transposase InsO family protein
MVEAVGDAPPRYVLRDRDSDYDARFRARLRGLGVRCLLSPLRAPLANATCERLVGTLRRDCVDHIMVVSERHTGRVLREYVRYYQRRSWRCDGSYSANAGRTVRRWRRLAGQRDRIETSIRLEQRVTPKQIAGTKCALA